MNCYISIKKKIKNYPRINNFQESVNLYGRFFIKSKEQINYNQYEECIFIGNSHFRFFSM